MSSRIFPSLDCFLIIDYINIRWSEDQFELGFIFREKINEIPNCDLFFILTINIIDHNLTKFFVDDGSSCNVLYTYTMDLLGIHQAGLQRGGRRDSRKSNPYFLDTYTNIQRPS